MVQRLAHVELSAHLETKTNLRRGNRSVCSRSLAPLDGRLTTSDQNCEVPASQVNLNFRSAAARSSLILYLSGHFKLGFEATAHLLGESRRCQCLSFRLDP
jgi:hypothetical protein